MNFFFFLGDIMPNTNDVQISKEENKNNEQNNNTPYDLLKVEDEEDIEARLYDEETRKLLDDKEDKLKTKFNNLSEPFKNTKLYDIIYYEKSNAKKKSESDESETKKGEIFDNQKEDEEQFKYDEKEKIKYDFGGRTCLLIYILGLGYFTFYLVAFFQLLDLYETCKNELRITFKSFFNNKTRESNDTFFDIYEKSCFKTIPEFDFAFFTSILGSFPLSACGYFISSAVFTILNTILFSIFADTNFNEKEKNSGMDFVHILLYSLLFFVTFGAISLYAHQKLSEGIITFSKMKEKYEERKKKEDAKKAEKKIDKPREEDNENEEVKKEKGELEANKEGEGGGKEEQEQVKKTEESNKDEGNKIIDTSKLNFSNDCLTEDGLFIFLSFGIILAYIVNRGINIGIYNNSREYFKENFVAVFIMIYIGSYVVSSIFYLFFYVEVLLMEKKDENENKNKKEFRFLKLFGFLIFYEKVPVKNGEKDKNIIINNNQVMNFNKDLYRNLTEKEKKTIKYKDTLLKVILPCYKDEDEKKADESKYNCATCKLAFRKCYYKSNNTEFETLCHRWCKCCKCEECCECYKDLQICSCCKRLELKETYEEEEIFCYVYQVQRKCSWFCDLFFKNNILSLIVHNLFVEVGILGFEKKINENLEEKSLKDDFVIIVVYLIFFLLFTLFNTSCCVSISKAKNYAGFSLFSFFFYIVDIILSAFSRFGSAKSRNRANNIPILLPIAYSKYLNFVVMDTLVSILDENNIDILSNSFVLTSVFVIYDIFAFIITDLIGISSDALVLNQFIFGFFIIAYVGISTYYKGERDTRKGELKKRSGTIRFENV